MAKRSVSNAVSVPQQRATALSPQPLLLKKPVYTLKEVAHMLGLSPSTLYDGIKAGNPLYPEPVMISRQMRFTTASILTCQKNRLRYYRQSGRGHI